MVTPDAFRCCGHHQFYLHILLGVPHLLEAGHQVPSPGSGLWVNGDAGEGQLQEIWRTRVIT